MRCKIWPVGLSAAHVTYGPGARLEPVRACSQAGCRLGFQGVKGCWCGYIRQRQQLPLATGWRVGPGCVGFAWQRVILCNCVQVGAWVRQRKPVTARGLQRPRRAEAPCVDAQRGCTCPGLPARNGATHSGAKYAANLCVAAAVINRSKVTFPSLYVQKLDGAGGRGGLWAGLGACVLSAKCHVACMHLIDMA